MQFNRYAFHLAWLANSSIPCSVSSSSSTLVNCNKNYGKDKKCLQLLLLFACDFGKGIFLCGTYT